MKTIDETLVQKELELARVGKELEALRIVAPLDGKSNRSEGVAHADQIGKGFIVVGRDVRQCLICDGVFTRQAASEHARVVCMPGFSMKTAVR